MQTVGAIILAALALLTACPETALFGAAHASPAPDAVVIRTRLENGCPGSLLFTTNAYPAELTFDEDSEVNCQGIANLHDWRFSEGGAAAVEFQNGDIFMFGATLTISGPGAAEAGLQITPWFTAGVGGRFNVSGATGAISCGGGVLPPYDFTAAQGVQYVQGEPIRLEINYVPRANSAAEPAWIEYKLDYAGEHHTSGLIEMTNCTPADEPAYGCYGILNGARVGGYARMLWPQGGNEQVVVSFTGVDYAPEGKATPLTGATWGGVKRSYR